MVGFPFGFDDGWICWACLSHPHWVHRSILGYGHLSLEARTAESMAWVSAAAAWRSRYPTMRCRAIAGNGATSPPWALVARRWWKGWRRTCQWRARRSRRTRQRTLRRSKEGKERRGEESSAFMGMVFLVGPKLFNAAQAHEWPLRVPFHFGSSPIA